MAAPSKNYRYSTNLQVAIDANTRLVIAVGRPQPGNHNDCTAFRDSGINHTLAGQPVMADGGYHGNPQVIMPYRYWAIRTMATLMEHTDSADLPASVTTQLQQLIDRLPPNTSRHVQLAALLRFRPTAPPTVG